VGNEAGRCRRICVLQFRTLCVRAAGGLQRFVLVDGNLEDVDNGYFYTKAADLADE